MAPLFCYALLRAAALRCYSCRTRALTVSAMRAWCCGAIPGARSGCDPKNRSAGSLQAGPEPTLLGSGGVHGLVLKNISVLAAGDASLSALTWSCTPGSLHGAAVEISPSLGAGCVSQL